MGTGAANVVSLPSGGGALAGLDEKFTPDLHTGTGNLIVPIAIPPGRHGMEPRLQLRYSTGAGNGPFGLGWTVPSAGIGRQIAHGVPRYDDERDVFVMSGTDDLVPIERQGSVTRYRPRIEGSFARILRHRDQSDDHWVITGTDGRATTCGSPACGAQKPRPARGR